MISANNVNDLVGATTYDNEGDKVGSVGQVYVDPDTRAPLWVTVKTGLFGTSESFVPVDDASFDGDTIRVPYEKAFIKDAPRVEDDGAMSEAEENALYAYYGNAEAGSVGTANVSGTSSTTTAGYDTSGSTTDDAMTRSEERLHVGTEKVEVGRARLRKHVVTEMKTITVPVSREEVTLVREPISEANIGDATAGPDISEEEHEIVLTEERVIVSKETVPVERVALDTKTVTEQRQVTEEVAHEEIELIEPGTADTNNRI
ncbi:MAG: hypothetical protein JWQ43_2827 [Glaciihabitans sp.]|nr:hypothetical protein [Glaciihabitans sp.]